MADSDEAGSYSEDTQRAKVAAGCKGGPFNQNRIMYPKMTFSDPRPPEVTEKLQSGPPASGNVSDPHK